MYKSLRNSSILLLFSSSLIVSHCVADDFTDEDLDVEDDTADQYCTDTEVVDKFKYIFLPNDYRIEPINGSLEKWKNGIRSFDDVKNAYNHVMELKDNISAKVEPLNKVLTNRLKDVLISLPFNEQCMTSLLAISVANNANQQWALDC